MSSSKPTERSMALLHQIFGAELHSHGVTLTELQIESTTRVIEVALAKEAHDAIAEIQAFALEDAIRRAKGDTEALRRALYHLVRPDSKPVPDHYRCSVCEARGCKLWRLSTFLEHIKVFCCECAAKREKVDIGDIDADGKVQSQDGRTDQIGGLVPAVPVGDDTYWSYSSVPPRDVRWWRSLPTRPR